jgi:hypothetical protein
MQPAKPVNLIPKALIAAALRSMMGHVALVEVERARAPLDSFGWPCRHTLRPAWQINHGGAVLFEESRSPDNNTRQAVIVRSGSTLMWPPALWEVEGRRVVFKMFPPERAFPVSSCWLRP